MSANKEPAKAGTVDLAGTSEALVQAVKEGVAASAPRAFTAHSQAALERLITEERAVFDLLSDLDAKIEALKDERADAFAAYSAILLARETLAGGRK